MRVAAELMKYIVNMMFHRDILELMAVYIIMKVCDGAYSIARNGPMMTSTLMDKCIGTAGLLRPLRWNSADTD